MKSSHKTKKAETDCPDLPRVFRFLQLTHRNGAPSEKIQTRVQTSNFHISFQYLGKSTIFGEYRYLAIHSSWDFFFNF